MQMYAKYQLCANKTRKIYRKTILFNVYLHFVALLRLFCLQKVVVLGYIVLIVFIPCLIAYIQSNYTFRYNTYYGLGLVI